MKDSIAIAYGRDQLLALVTVGRLAAIPVVSLALVAHEQAGVVLALGFFVMTDYLDGAFARHVRADGIARRILDSLVDRVAIWSVFGTAIALGYAPIALACVMFMRDLVCAAVCWRMIVRCGAVIRPGWPFRIYNGLLAMWILAATLISEEARVASLAAIGLIGYGVAIHLSRSAALLGQSGTSLAGRVVDLRELSGGATDRVETPRTTRAAARPVGYSPLGRPSR